MRKIRCFKMAAFALGICLMFSGCKMVKNLKALTEIRKTEPAETESTAEPEDQTVSFEAYIKEGETFTFSFEPADVASYEELRNAEFREMLSLDNWDQYFEVKELYWEHMEYDEDGQETQTYMKGDLINLMLKEDYWYVDNVSQNGIQLFLHIVGEETRVMHNDGVTYEPITSKLDVTREYTGDDIIVEKDFINSWDERTQEAYTGSLESYRMEQAQGDMYLIDATVVEFKKYSEDIYYFAAYGAKDEYFVIFVQTDDEKLDRNKEYDGVLYITSGNKVNQRVLGNRSKKIILKDSLREALQYVNK